MPHLTVAKTEHAGAARYELRSDEVALYGQASHGLQWAWIDAIEGVVGDTPFALVPRHPGEGLALPTGGPMALSEGGAEAGLLRSGTAAEQASWGGDKRYLAQYGSRRFIAYHVGFGRKGQHLCVYETSGAAETLTAQVEVPTRVADFLPSYEVAAVDERACRLGAYLALYYDYSNERNWRDRALKAERVNLKLTLNRKLKAKYDPGFSSRV